MFQRVMQLSCAQVAMRKTIVRRKCTFAANRPGGPSSTAQRPCGHYVTSKPAEMATRRADRVVLPSNGHRDHGH